LIILKTNKGGEKMAQAIRELKKRGAKTREINESLRHANALRMQRREQAQESENAPIKLYTIMDLATGISVEQRAKTPVKAISVFLAKSSENFQEEYRKILSQFENNTLTLEQVSKNYEIKEVVIEEVPSNTEVQG
jgi:hypothetical protein